MSTQPTTRPASGQDYDALEHKIQHWASGEPSIVSAWVVGSRARTTPPPDAWSDLDLILLTTDPSRLTGDRAWLERFGPIWLAHLFTGYAHPEWQVVYQGGLKVDFLLAAVSPTHRAALPELLQAFPDRGVLARGVRLLGDPQPLAVPAPPPPEPLTAQAFAALVDETLLLSMRIERLLRRRETWQAQHELSCALRPRLLSLLERQAALTRPGYQDTWYHGRRLHTWADPHYLQALPAVFADYRPAGIHQALLAALDLFSALFGELAERLGFPCAWDDSPLLIWIREAPPEERPQAGE